jgi:3-mercaptopyruvate sulfurtransferase SseA
MARTTDRRVAAGPVHQSIEGSAHLHATSLFEDRQGFLSFCGAGYMANINCFGARLLGLEQVRMYDGSLLDWNARGGALLPSGGA